MSIVLPQSEKIRLERILHSANDLPVAFFKPAQVRIYVSRCKRNVFSFCSTPSGPGYLRVVSYSYVSFHVSNNFLKSMEILVFLNRPCASPILHQHIRSPKLCYILWIARGSLFSSCSLARKINGKHVFSVPWTTSLSNLPKSSLWINNSIMAQISSKVFVSSWQLL